MATIDSVKLPDNSTYDLTDNYSGYQKQTLTTPLTINGTQETTVEGALGGLNDYGDALADNLAANEESGAKNHADASTATTERLSNNNGVFTNAVADDYTYFYMYIQAWTGGTFISNIANQSITATGDYSYNITIPSGTDTLQIIHNGGIYDLRAKFNCDVEGDYIISFRVLGTDPRTIGGLSFDKVMIRDARILDPTFAPFAETNLQLTHKTSGLSNRNLVDNGWFTVNQRGAGTITSGDGADRWEFIEGTSATFNSNGVSLDNSFICQVFENQLPNGLYTASVKYQDGTIEHGTAIKADDSTVITFFTSSTGFKLMYTPLAKRFDVNGKNASTTSIRAVKLEVGTVSTLHLDVAPDYTTELLKCQRYFYRVNQEVATAMFALVMGLSATVAYTPFRTPVPMRATPSISFGGSFNLVDASNTNAVATISFSAYTGDLGTLSIGSSNLTPSNMYILTCGVANSYIDLSADL